MMPLTFADLSALRAAHERGIDPTGVFVPSPDGLRSVDTLETIGIFARSDLVRENRFLFSFREIATPRHPPPSDQAYTAIHHPQGALLDPAVEDYVLSDLTDDGDSAVRPPQAMLLFDAAPYPQDRVQALVVSVLAVTLRSNRDPSSHYYTGQGRLPLAGKIAGPHQEVVSPAKWHDLHLLRVSLPTLRILSATGVFVVCHDPFKLGGPWAEESAQALTRMTRHVRSIHASLPLLYDALLSLDMAASWPDEELLMAPCLWAETEAPHAN